MTGPTRLLESPTPAVRALLRAGVDERPSHRALQRTALTLGVSASVVGAAGTASAGATLGAAAPSALVVAGKWLLVGTLGGLGLAASADALSGAPSRTTPAVPAHAPAAPQATVSAVSPVPLQITSVVEPVPSAHAESKRQAPSAVAVPAAPSASVGTASGVLPEAQDLSREVAAIDAARSAIAMGDAVKASRFLDDYASRPRTGTLEREAQLLRIDALLLRGDTAAARALARSYAQSYPKDPRLTRFRALLDQP